MKINNSSNVNYDFKMKNSSCFNFNSNEGKNKSKVLDNRKNDKNFNNHAIRNNNAENIGIIKNNILNRNKFK